MKTYLILPLFIATNTYAGRTEVCPKFSPVMIMPEIDVKVSFDKKTENYTYQYKVTNLASARVPIDRIGIESNTAPISLKAPKSWDDPKFDNYLGNPENPDNKNNNAEIRFTTIIDNVITPGKTLDGFEIISKKSPGIVRVYSQGDVDVDELPTIKYDTDEEYRKGDDESITCPGWFRSGGLHGDHVATFTIGPSIPNRVEAKIRIKKAKEKKWHGGHHKESENEISPLDTGKIQVILFGNKDLDVAKIDLSSLEFGRGKAKPIKTQIIGEFKVGEDVDDEIKKHDKENQGVQHLLMEFNLQDVDVKCDIDRALFLTGKIGKKDLFGAVKIKHVVCDKKTFSREAKKMKEHGDSH